MHRWSKLSIFSVHSHKPVNSCINLSMFCQVANWLKNVMIAHVLDYGIVGRGDNDG